MAAALVTLIVLASAILAACVCDPYIHVDVRNRTDERVVVFDDGIERGVIGPGDSGDFAIHTFEGNRTFTVKTFLVSHYLWYRACRMSNAQSTD